jgi:hypothetical protein
MLIKAMTIPLINSAGNALTGSKPAGRGKEMATLTSLKK